MIGSMEISRDLDRGTTELHDFGPGSAGGEGVFVPRDGGTAEDDGWVMAIVHEPASETAELVVLAADDFAGEPVARVHLPQRVPMGFHGNWAPAG